MKTLDFIVNELYSGLGEGSLDGIDSYKFEPEDAAFLDKFHKEHPKEFSIVENAYG